VQLSVLFCLYLQAGLSQNLRSVPWFKDVDPNTFYPRCYNLADADEKAAFFGNINLHYNHVYSYLMLSCSRQRLSNDDGLGDKREDYQNCSGLYHI